MRIGLSSSLKHDTPSQWAEKMKELGCGAVVFPVDYTAPEELIEAYAGAAKKAGLVIAEVGACAIRWRRQKQSAGRPWSAASDS